jgi:uncharacterized protein (DUF433 family)
LVPTGIVNFDPYSGVVFLRIGFSQRLIYAVDYRDVITVESGKRGGKPCIRGMRITVYDVLDYLASGMTTEEILDDFPYLTEDNLRACLQYAAERERHVRVGHR